MMGCPLQLWLVALLFASGVEKTQAAGIFFSIGADANVNPFLNDGASIRINLTYPFMYNNTDYSYLYLSMNGFVSFFKPMDEFYPDANVGKDMIAPFWADIENDWSGTISYEQATDGPLLTEATDAVKQALPDTDFEEAVWVFVATWQNTTLELDPVAVSFQLVLTTDDDGRAYILMNYQDIPLLQETWLAGFVKNNNFNHVPVNNSSELPLRSNIGLNGRWVFEVSSVDSCKTVQCTENEVCVERTGIYGCDCADHSLRPNPDTFDATETCSGSSGTVSLSRCELFEAGFPAQFLHLNDPKCKGVVDGERVIFQFDNDGRKCGTNLWNNATHFIYGNNIRVINGQGYQSVISRDGWLNIDISCAYPLIQSISMPMAIRPGTNVVYKNLPTEGTYEIHMLPYPDDSFSTPYSGDVVVVDVNQQIYVSVDVFGVDSTQISLVLESCWATPFDDMNSGVRWDLLIETCPNPEDGTVEVLQNGDSTSGRFSFRMFTFTARSSNVYLHCQVHLCLVENGNCHHTCGGDSDRRRRRSLGFHDSASISMSF